MHSLRSGSGIEVLCGYPFIDSASWIRFGNTCANGIFTNSLRVKQKNNDLPGILYDIYIAFLAESKYRTAKR